MMGSSRSPQLRSLLAASALFCCWLAVADGDVVTTAPSIARNSSQSTTTTPAKSSAPLTTSTADPAVCGALQEESGISGSTAAERCRWSAAFYAVVTIPPVVVVTAVVILAAVLCRRRQLCKRQDQENVEANKLDGKQQKKRKKNDYTGPPVAPATVQSDPNDIDYSLVAEGSDPIYGNDETIYANTTLGCEPSPPAADRSGDGVVGSSGAFSAAIATADEANEVDNLPQAPRPPTSRGSPKGDVHQAVDGKRKAGGAKAGRARGAEAHIRAPRINVADGVGEPSTADALTAGRAPRHQAAGGGGGGGQPAHGERTTRPGPGALRPKAAGSGEPSKSDTATAVGLATRQRAASRDDRPSKPSEAEAAAAHISIFDKLKAVAAEKRRQMEMEEQETEPVYENVKRKP